tara:strand:- start:473 stop:778 length:306 start_codon:yes stop_codon:yes gene_type:complete
MSNLTKVSVIARAFGTIAWGAEKTLQTGGKAIKAGVNALRNKPKYDVMFTVEGKVLKVYNNCNRGDVNKALEMLHELPGSTVSISSVETGIPEVIDSTPQI